MKGLTYIELLLVLGIFSFVMGIIGGIYKVQDYFKTTRDLQRLKDLSLINSALNFYFQNANFVDPDGPYLENRGIDESLPTIFVSVPEEKEKFFETCYYYQNNKIYYIYQTNKNDYQKINGYGWIPINFLTINYPSLTYLPVDPVNDLKSGLYYLYAFKRNPLKYEIAAFFESKEFQKNGIKDIVSKDGGDDDLRLELGTDLNIIPPFIPNF